MTETNETTIGREMDYFVKIISSVAVFFGVLFFIVGLFKFGGTIICRT